MPHRVLLHLPEEVDKIGTGYTFQQQGWIDSATSGYITEGSAVQLSFLHNREMDRWKAFLLSPSFQFLDGGNTVTSATNTITLSIGIIQVLGHLQLLLMLECNCRRCNFSGESIDKMELAIPLCNFCRIIFSSIMLFNVTVVLHQVVFSHNRKWDRWQ